MTIGEAAERLRLSPKTIRRWVKDGKLAATKTPGPYGDQYDISEETLQAMQTALAVVVAKPDPVDPHSLALAIAEALTTRDEQTAAAIDALRHEISELRDEIRTKPVRRSIWPWQKQP